MQARPISQRPTWGAGKLAETATERRARRFQAPLPPVQPLPQMLWTNQGWMQLPPSAQPTPAFAPMAPYPQSISATSSIPVSIFKVKQPNEMVVC